MGVVLVAACVSGCSDGAEASASVSAEPCANDTTSLRLWTFSLSHPDTVTLKNTSRCPVELEGVELLFDDRDDAFPEGTAVDCSVRLPGLVLEGGASVHVSELPFPGEIDALSHEVSGCAYPLTFNPDRGGVTYLCGGPCDATTLIDAVAHFGDDLDVLEPGTVNRYREPPPMRFGATFESPVWGTNRHNDGLVRYQRVTTNGSFPAFAGSDWGIQSKVLFADFEDGVRSRAVQSSPVSWGVVPGEPAEIVTTLEAAASFAASLRLVHAGQDGASVALAAPLDAFSTPRDLSYFARVDAPGVTAGNLELRALDSPIVELGFETDGIGATHDHGARTAADATPDRWYRIELRDIDWLAGTFDLYVDGTLLGGRLPFGAAGHADELRLRSQSGGSIAFFDALELWGEAYALGRAETGDGLGVMRCGIAASDDGAPSGPTCDDIDGPSADSASCESYCSAWDAICCGELFAENYATKADCLADCATFTPAALCCRASHGRIGGPERCRYALGAGTCTE